MDTSNNFRVIDLERNEHPEDRQLALKADVVVRRLIEELKPILRYIAVHVPVMDREAEEGSLKCSNPSVICNPYSTYRAIKLIEIGYEKDMLFLKEDGRFFSAELCRCSRQEKHYHLTKGTEPWKLVSFQELITSLERALRQAEEKRHQHLQTIQERHEKLDQILEILKK